MSFSLSVESGILGYLFNFTDVFSSVKYNTLYVGLASGLPDNSGTNLAEVEFVGGSYARVSLTNDSTNFYSATGETPAIVYNKTEISFPIPSADWGTATHYFVLDDDDGLIARGAIVPGKEISSGETVKFSVSGLYLAVG